MPKLTLSVRLAAASILLLSLLHAVFWALLAYSAHSGLPPSFPYNYVFPVLCVFSAAGLPGVIIGAGIFRLQNWARVAALVIAALVALFCAFALLVLFIVSFGLLSAGPGVEIPEKSDLLRVGLFYFFIFALAVWWILLFSRKSVAAQFSAAAPADARAIPKKAACPPPIALLAWLMIISSALSALSWPLILGKIPAMLFTHIFAPDPSRLIWIANILLFAVCGIGLLKLQRWSYTSTIALHLFWLVSLLVTQLSSNYDAYTRICLNTLALADAYPVLNHIHFPQWISASSTALPTALLLAGLFYCRRSFLEAVQNSRHPAT
ncbi:MAG TPA: hypothetical protein VKP58_10380 [Candidatus Acidoferrum sp.]|nr:hypothetical protein [Candidatus Acidoferrum sp.]